MSEPKFKLCYVDGNWAYFTTCDLEKQWGDDWDDSPFEYNAGEPYYWDEYRDMPRYEIEKIAFEVDMVKPNEYHLNSPYTVQMINRGSAPWLRTYDGKVNIFAGTTLEDFKRIIKENDGAIYIEEK